MREIILAMVVLLLTGAVASVFLMDITPPTRVAPSNVPARDASEREIATFFAAVEQDQPERVTALLSRFPTLIEARSAEHGETPLHRAGSVAMAELLVQAGADAGALDRTFSATPARWARAAWHSDVARYLETRFPPDDDLVHDVAAGNVMSVRYALERSPGLINQRTDEREVLGAGRHLLAVAAAHGQTAVARVLLEAGADVNGDTEAAPHEHTPLWHAAMTGREEIVRLLLDAGAKVEDGLAEAVRAAARRPQKAHNLPSQASYLRVAAMLEE